MEEYEATIIEIEDDEGNKSELELLNEFELDGKNYSVFVPANIDEMDEDDPDFGLIFLENIEVDGQPMYQSIDDDDELDRVYDYYEQAIEEEEDEE